MRRSWNNFEEGGHALDLPLLLFHVYHFDTITFFLYYICHSFHYTSSYIIWDPPFFHSHLFPFRLSWLFTPFFHSQLLLFWPSWSLFYEKMFYSSYSLKKVLLWFQKTFFISYIFFTTNRIRICEKHENN